MKRKKSFIKDSKIKSSPFSDYWKNNNFYLLLISITILIVGYYLMAAGSWNNPISLTVSPIILIITYLILFPAVILLKAKSKKEDSVVSSKSER